MVVSKNLKDFLDTKKHDYRLLGHVERHILKRQRKPRRTDVLHPSEIIKSDWCHRYSWYLLNGGVKNEPNPGLRLQNIFDEGHSIHEKWQTRFYEMDVLFGEFKCRICNETTEGISVIQCSSCGSNLMEYGEVTLLDEDLRIEGHTDGWIRGIGDDCLIEIKSVGEGTIRSESPELLMDNNNDPRQAWKSIRRPFRSHLLQGQLYLELARRMFGEDAPKEIVFIYEYKADQDYKEFVSKADPEIVDKILYHAKKIVNATTMPSCNVNPEGCKQCNLIS